MKKTFLAVAVAAAFATMSFAQTTPPASGQNPPSKESTKKPGKKNTKKTDKQKSEQKGGSGQSK